MTTKITKLLIANRGEIALRVMRTARQAGIRTVAVFSDADANAPFVAFADEAVRLPGVTPAETYLRGDLILDAAKRTGANAVHPGYGFLSENAEFARKAGQAGIVFVGPSPEAIAAMGSKIEAKKLMDGAGVPVLPGLTVTGELSEADLVAGAEQIRYPILVKASAGGGGRGMRIVNQASELTEAVASARREAGSAFGDDTVFLEKYVTAPRHIEVQIFGDATGRVISLFERECSIQRRYQKIIEEAPSPVVTPEQRERLGAAAVAAGEALSYTGAGTVEFIMDQSGDFYFLEVNTRLQVEHPVTESITGLDLVRLQLLVAEGHPLPDEALTATITGHAIEVRLYAEDPANGFLPTSGTLRAFSPGESGTLPDAIRVDSGFVSGDAVSIHYDPMLAKVIAYAPTRTEAALALADALRRSRIHGVGTNRDLLIGILTEEEFLAGQTDTAYLERHPVAELAPPPAGPELAAAAAVLALRAHRREGRAVQTSVSSGFRNVPSQDPLVRLSTAEGDLDVRYAIATDSARITVAGEPIGDDIRFSVTPSTDGGSQVVLEVDGLRGAYTVTVHENWVDVDGPAGAFEFGIVDLLPVPGAVLAAGSLAAPMPGSVVRLEVEVGATVTAGQPVVVLEAMKMEHAVRAPVDGVVESIAVSVGEQVDVGQVLAVVTEEEDAS